MSAFLARRTEVKTGQVEFITNRNNVVLAKRTYECLVGREKRAYII